MADNGQAEKDRVEKQRNDLGEEKLREKADIVEKATEFNEASQYVIYT